MAGAGLCPRDTGALGATPTLLRAGMGCLRRGHLSGEDGLERLHHAIQVEGGAPAQQPARRVLDTGAGCWKTGLRGWPRGPARDGARGNVLTTGGLTMPMALGSSLGFFPTVQRKKSHSTDQNHY